MSSKFIPIFVLILIVEFFIRLLFASDNEQGSLQSDCFGLSRRDIILLSAICLCYGFIAFHLSGSMNTPQSCVHFKANDRVFFSVDDNADPCVFKAYTGLNTGRYALQAYDPDLGEYVQVGELDQEYSGLFQWNEFYISEENIGKYRSFSITALTDLYLYEVVVLNGSSEQIYDIAAENSSAAALFDEQDTYAAKSWFNGTYFDEIYHARTALEHIEGVRPYEITHPPLGKIIISLGIDIFGMNPFGWRFSGILFGILMLIPFYALIKQLFSCSLISACGTLIFAFDFMHFTQTRIATIDTYAVFFIILMYLFMYLYRCSDEHEYLWLGLCGISFGLGCACKWTCIYAGLGLAAVWLNGFAGMLKKALADGIHLSECLKNIAFCLVFFIAVPAIIYYLSYIPYGRAEGMSGAGMLFSGDYLKTVLNNQKYMFSYHSNIVAEHPYSSRWYEWLLDTFPMLYYLEYLPDGRKSVIGCLVNPLVCWSGLISIIYILIKSLFERDRRSMFILIGFLSQLIPWIFIKRLTFEYHYFPSTVFLILSICEVFNDYRERLRRGGIYITAFTILCLCLFAMFYPVISGIPVSQDYSESFLKWLPRWYI